MELNPLFSWYYMYLLAVKFLVVFYSLLIQHSTLSSINILLSTLISQVNTELNDDTHILRKIKDHLDLICMTEFVYHDLI